MSHMYPFGPLCFLFKWSIRLSLVSKAFLQTLHWWFLGIAGTNRGWLDTSISWYEAALSNVTQADSKDDIIFAKTQMKDAKKTHDHYLMTRGPISEIHRTNALPFDAKLKKKKKFKKVKQTKVEKHIALTPLFKIPQSKREQKNLNWNFRAVCSQKNKMRTPEHDTTLVSLNRN